MTAITSKNVDCAFLIGQKVAECARVSDLHGAPLRLLEGSLRASGSMFIQRSNSGNGHVFEVIASHQMPERATLQWNNVYQRIDPVLSHYINRAIPHSQHVVVSADVMPEMDFVATAFYREFLRPLSIFHVMLVGLTDQFGRLSAAISLHRPRRAQPFSRLDIDFSELVATYFSAHFQRIRADADLSGKTLVVDQLMSEFPEEGLAILDENLDIVFANTTAKTVLWPDRIGYSDGGAQVRSATSVFRKCERLRREAHLHGRGSTLTIEFDTSSDTNEIEIKYLRPDYNEFGGHFVLRIQSKSGSRTSKTRLKKLGITDRQIDVVRLVVKGMTNAEIADQLCISIRTVENHLRTVYSRLEVNNRTGLIYRLGQ